MTDNADPLIQSSTAAHPSPDSANPNPLSVHINADARQAWIMLREPGKLRQWHGWDYDGLDEEIRTIYFSSTAVEDQDHSRLSLGDGTTFRIEPVADGTAVTVELGEACTGDTAEGWISFLHQLRFALERHPNTARRTAFLSGKAGNGQSILSKLNAEQLQQPGDKYALSLPGGQEITGKVWFRTNNQLGLTVQQYAAHGDGLLILADQPAGSALLIASTYELGAHRLREIWEGWEAFRREHYPDADPLVTSELA